jgi:hypothetical protein
MKTTDMKTYSIIFLLLVLLGFGFSSCNKEEDTVIVPKTTEAYKLQMSQFISAEKAVVEAATVGFNKGNIKTLADSTSKKPPYLTVLLAAEEVLNKVDLTGAEIVAANKTLTVPGKAFWGVIFTSDRRPLNDSIVSAEALNTATTAGAEAGQILQASKTTFTTAITAAKSVRSASTTLERQVTDAINILDEAKKVFIAAIIPNTIEEYQLKSSQFIGAEKLKVETCSVGYNKDDYNETAKTAYLNVLIAAETVVNTAGATFAQISAAMATLTLPGKAFYDSRFISDRRVLNDSIIVAEALNEATISGTEIGQVPVAAKTTFTTAINTAKTARETATTIEGKVKEAVFKLSEAKKAFVAAIIK